MRMVSGDTSGRWTASPVWEVIVGFRRDRVDGNPRCGAHVHGFRLENHERADTSKRGAALIADFHALFLAAMSLDAWRWRLGTT